MTRLTYNLSRQEAAEKLDISTRTLDRYVKAGKLSHKKIANKIFLSADEIDMFHERRNSDYTTSSEILSNYGTENSHNNDEQTKQAGSEKNIIDQNEISKIQEFFQTLEKKDAVIEQKMQTIFVLQHRIGQLEQELSQTIALPDYTQMQQDITLEKEKLSIMHEKVSQDLEREKNKNSVLILLVAVAVAVVLFLIAQVSGRVFN